jgi:large subunit ribosomal protein L30
MVNNMAKIKLTQVKSVIDRTQKQKDTMKALGLNKINASNEIEVSPQVLGMVEKVKHLITVEHI